MIHLLLFVLASSAFLMLCLARDRHQRDVLGRKLSATTAKRLRAGAAACLLLAFLLAGLKLGWGYGTVEWLGQLSAGALVTVFLLAHLSGRKPSPR